MQVTEELVSTGGARVHAKGQEMENNEANLNEKSATKDPWRIELPWISEETLAMSRLNVLCARDPDEEEEEEEDLDYFSDDEEDDDDLDDEDDLDEDFEEEDDEEDDADDDEL